MFRSARFRKLFLIRFTAYFFILTGFVTILLIVEPVFTEELRFNFDQILNRHHTLPRIVTSVDTGLPAVINQVAEVVTPTPKGQRTGFGSLTASATETIVPVDTNFGIVIEKINANAKVVPDVDPTNEKAYVKALGGGVAHAKSTVYPGQKGNIYLFSHSADAPWNIVRYNAIFYLLGKLDKGDRIIMFYQGRRYDYIVFDKVIAAPDDVSYLTRTYDESVLSLQTCDPPGTLVNRLIVRAKLATI